MCIYIIRVYDSIPGFHCKPTNITGPHLVGNSGPACGGCGQRQSGPFLMGTASK